MLGQASAIKVRNQVSEYQPLLKLAFFMYYCTGRKDTTKITFSILFFILFHIINIFVEQMGDSSTLTNHANGMTARTIKTAHNLSVFQST